MSETLWEQGAVVEAEAETGVATEEPVAEPVALTVSADDFSALEERVLRAVELVKRERQQRAAAEGRAAAAEDRAAEAEARTTRAEAQLREQSPVVDQMEAELDTLKAERDHVRQRVERLLEQLDGLEL